MKDNDKNVFSILALLIFVSGFIIGKSLWINILILISSLIFSIIGIIKSIVLKKKTGKRKGIVISIIILLLVSIMLFAMPLYRLIKATKPTDTVSYSQLNEIELIAFDALKEFYYILGDTTGNIKNIQIDSMYYQEKDNIDNGEEKCFIIYINYIEKDTITQKCYIYNNTKTFIDNEKVDEWITNGKEIECKKIIQVYTNTFFRRSK